ncbi:MAG: GntR family transcriptional regulator [Clostridiaceae bacterium]|nr:GntR family transcriptional regulator [Clostridiaceae bacterium]
MNISNSLNDVTYDAIRKDIMNMTLEPGMNVSVQKLSERYGVSRTPVREAIVRLQQSGLVEIYPQRMTVVSKIDLDRICEELFIRTSLEAAVVDKFIHRCSELVGDTMQELINKQRKYMDKEYFTEFYSKDNRFHQLIFETAGQALAWKTVENVSSHYSRIRILHGKINGVASIIDGHERILAAVRKRDSEAMRKAVMEYSSNLLEQVKSMSKQYPHFFSNDFQQP